MGNELQKIKKALNQNQKSKTITKSFSNNNIFLSNNDGYSSQNKSICYHLSSAFLLPAKNNFFVRIPLYSPHIRKLPVNFLKPVFIYINCIKKVLPIKSLKEENYTFKTFYNKWINDAKTLLKPLFHYNCKNIFVLYSEKTNLSFRMDNKTKSSACKVLQTTTI